MSLQSATRFLSAAAHDGRLRARFAEVRSPEDFVQVSDQLGYRFTTAELQQTVSQLSQDVQVRRATGVWRWLRTVEWV